MGMVETHCLHLTRGVSGLRLFDVQCTVGLVHANEVTVALTTETRTTVMHIGR